MTAVETLVLVPGTLCDRAIFSEAIDALGSTLDVVVADVTASSTIEALAQDVLDQSPDRFALLGLSLGGIIAAKLAQIAPGKIIGLALFDTNLGAPSKAQLDQRTHWAREVRTGHFAQIVSDDLVRPLSAFPERHGSEIFDMAMRIGPAAFLRQNRALIARSDLHDALDELRVPILVANGELDEICPTELHAALVNRSNDASHEVIPGAGHLSTLDQPAAAATAIQRWLQTCNNTKHLQEGKVNEYNIA